MAEVHEAAVVARPAFAELFDEHFDAIHGYLRGRVGEAAEELAAETFARALAGYERFDPARGDARPWLFGIATNVVHGHRRAERRRLRAYAREAGRAGPPPAPPDVPARLDAAAQARVAGRAIARLPAGERDVLLLVAWADLTYEEVAGALGVPVGTVRSRLHRARLAVRAALQRHEEEDR
jgi:RNA polymerase sigma-70 factor (ECF subfamily)